MADEPCFESDDPELAGRDSAASPRPEVPWSSLDFDLERDHKLDRREGVLPVREDTERPFARLARTSTPSEALRSILQVRCRVSSSSLYPKRAGYKRARGYTRQPANLTEGATRREWRKDGRGSTQVRQNEGNGCEQVEYGLWWSDGRLKSPGPWRKSHHYSRRELV